MWFGTFLVLLDFFLQSVFYDAFLKKIKLVLFNIIIVSSLSLVYLCEKKIMCIESIHFQKHSFKQIQK